MNIIVNNYKIFLDINTTNLYYIGHVLIDLNVLNNINELILNCQNIDIHKFILNNKKYPYQYDKNKNEIKITYNFTKNNYKLYFMFKNVISDDLEGIYYTKESNKLVICTQLEPTYARRVFPCFDDPIYKSTFELSVKLYDNAYNCISNMPIKKINTALDYKIYIFDKTPLMSTYLLCVVIGDIVPVLSKPLITSSGVLINGYCLKEHVKYMKWAIKHAKKSIEYFEKWFDIKYQLPKLDIMSIPNFRSGAMENWGVVTFREEYILLFNKFSDSSKLVILEVLYHELAHQWFGNLVTMKNWTNLWLNESNATYFSWNALHEKYPKYESKLFYNILEYKKTQLIDGFTNTHPIIPKNINNISDIFDEISYAKGSCLINYISGVLGYDNFKDAIRKYIHDHKYSNADSLDLYKYFNKYNVNIDFNKLINDLIHTKGYPIFNLEIQNNKLIITKEKFNLNKNIKEEYNTDIYIKLQKSNNTEILNLNSKVTTIDITNNEFHLNPSSEFLCIINYINFKPSFKIMNDIDILKYIDDEFIFSTHGFKSLKNYLDIVNDIITNNLLKSNILLLSILSDINRIFNILILNNNNKLLSELTNYVNTNFKKKLLKLTIKFLKTKIKYSEELLDQLLILFTINLKYDKMINYAKELFISTIKIYNNTNKFYLSKSLFKIINNFYPEYTPQILNLLNTTNITYIKHNIIESFQYINIDSYNNIINNFSKFIKLQDYSLLFMTLSKNKNIQSNLLNFIFNNSKNLQKNYDIFLHILKNISTNIFNLELNDLFQKYILSIYNKKHDISFNKILDILNINKTMLVV